MIKIIIVSFNVPVDEAATLVSIRRIFERDKHLAASFLIHVWDNSSINRLDEVASFFTPVGIKYDYTSTPHNLSLSEIYNNCAASPESCGYLMVLDQDTHITEAYIRESLLHAQQGHHLILPRVYSKDKLVSPATRFYCKGRLLNSIQPGLTASKNLLAINSGMIINYSVFRKFTYHSDLRFYGTDTWFMVNYEKHFSVVSIMVSELFHSLHFDSAPDKAWKKSYYQEQIRVNRIVFSEGWKMCSISWLYNIYLKITKA